MIKYLGSKRLLVPRLVAVVDALPGVRRVLDLYSGTARVGAALKARGYHVTCNDHNAFAHVLARAYVQADGRLVREEVGQRLAELRAVAEREGERAGDDIAAIEPAIGTPTDARCADWFTRTYCERARYFRPANGARITAVRQAIAAMRCAPDVEAALLAALLEASDRVDSTTGVQMAYLKRWAPRSGRALELRMPVLLDGPGRALDLEAVDAARATPADVAYLDPPYNQHSYLGNYHVWETLVRWDEPETYGVAAKRVDCRSRKSAHNSRPRARAALAEVLDACRAPRLLVSFSDEGYLSRAEMEDLLAPRGALAVLSTDFPRYVGAKIGIHNPRGERVGTPGRLRNVEHLFVVVPDASELDAVRAAWDVFGAEAEGRAGASASGVTLARPTS
ncbi:MAG: DNA adenine methylase [Planctomycetes bacterium]|nr:DNA adenine methylase [Planctomycetota bacterium]